MDKIKRNPSKSLHEVGVKKFFKAKPNAISQYKYTIIDFIQINL